mgnify:CR=1 FL=1
MKLISWNVNGIRACVGKNFMEFFNEVDADIFCLQETKLQENQIDLQLEGYYQYWNYAKKKGYSGTSIFTKKEPLNVIYGMGIEEHDQEGRLITLEFEDFYMVTVYTPNSQSELKRLNYRMKWEDDFKKYLKELDKKKPVIVCGDLNVAHKEIDLKNPKTNRKNAGFTDEERNKYFGKAPATIYENISALDKYPEKVQVLKRNDVLTEQLINSVKIAVTNRWILEISHRVLNSYGDKIRGYKALHSVDKALDLDITNWTNINNLRVYLMKDTYTNKSLFTRIKEAFDKKDLELASNLYIELEEKMEELRKLYSSYKRNLLDI